MAKLTISNISADYGATGSINAAFDAIEAAIENTLSRDGTSPNAMDANLDMNSYDIANVGTLQTTEITVNGSDLTDTVQAYTGYSEEWANKAEDSLVSTAAGGDGVDDYSSLHWSNKAKAYGAEWATKAEDSLISTVAGGDGSTDYSALHWAAKASASASAAAASYDAFDDRYLGSKASAPTLDNDGNALLTGALYWNSTSNTLYIYNGSGWIQAYTSFTGISDSATEVAITIDSSENIGIGTTPSAWGAAYDAFQINARGGLFGTSTGSGQVYNAYNDGTNWRRIEAAAAVLIQIDSSGNLLFYRAGSAAADSVITWTLWVKYSNALGVEVGTPAGGSPADGGINAEDVQIGGVTCLTQNLANLDSASTARSNLGIDGSSGVLVAGDIGLSTSTASSFLAPDSTTTVIPAGLYIGLYASEATGVDVQVRINGTWFTIASIDNTTAMGSLYSDGTNARINNGTVINNTIYYTKLS